MEQTDCDCSASGRQRVADCLSQEKLPLDNILQAGSELSSLFSVITECDRCIATKRISKWLIEMTIRLICFYEASIKQCLSSRAPALSAMDVLPLEPSPEFGCQLVSPEVRLGGLHVDEQEGRLLIKLSLAEACSDLNEKILMWKIAAEELLEASDQQHQVHYNDKVLGRCLDLLAKLIGLLQLDGSVADGCPANCQ